MNEFIIPNPEDSEYEKSRSNEQPFRYISQGDEINLNLDLLRMIREKASDTEIASVLREELISYLEKTARPTDTETREYKSVMNFLKNSVPIESEVDKYRIEDAFAVVFQSHGISNQRLSSIRALVLGE